MHRVIVYGTLKRYHSNHRLINKEYEFQVLVPIDKIESVWFPMVKLAEEKNIEEHKRYLLWEFYEVNDEVLKDLDRLEWEWHFYRRVDVSKRKDILAVLWNDIVKFKSNTEPLYIYEIIEDIEDDVDNWNNINSYIRNNTTYYENDKPIKIELIKWWQFIN